MLPDGARQINCAALRRPTCPDPPRRIGENTRGALMEKNGSEAYIVDSSEGSGFDRPL